jgi:hypothetical protein
MKVSKFNYFNYTIKSYLLKIFSLTFFTINFIFFLFSNSLNYYMYKDLVSLPNTSINNGFQEEYWLGHRMNNGSSRKNNVETRDNYILHTTKKNQSRR